MFLLVPAYPGCPGSKAVKRSLLLLYIYIYIYIYRNHRRMLQMKFWTCWHSHSLSVVSVLLAMLALLLTVGTPVLISGSTAVSTVFMVSLVAATSAEISDCRTLDVLIGIVWLDAAQNIIHTHTHCLPPHQLATSLLVILKRNTHATSINILLTVSKNLHSGSIKTFYTQLLVSL